MKYRVMVRVVGSREYTALGYLFDTPGEAEEYGRYLMSRWPAMRDFLVGAAEVE